MERQIDEITGIVVDAAHQLHVRLGPGLLESVYTTILARDLSRRGLMVEVHKAISIEYEGMRLDRAFVVDILVEGRVVVELKSIERLLPLHGKQVLTYLRLLDLSVGLLINFGGATLKEGLRRIVHNHRPSMSSPMRVDRPADAPFRPAETEPRADARGDAAFEEKNPK